MSVKPIIGLEGNAEGDTDFIIVGVSHPKETFPKAYMHYGIDVDRLKELFAELKRIKEEQPLMGCGELYAYIEELFGPLVPK